MTTSSILENIHAVENSMKNIVNNLKESIDDNEYHEIVMKMNSNIYCNNIEANATTVASLRFKNEDSINFDGIAWFPKKLSDFDLCSNNVIADADELAPNHPGLNDATYRERRKYFSDLARSYKYGQPLPKIEYTETEMKTWRTVFHELKKLHPTHACKEYLMNMNLLEKFCGYNEDNIPQIREVNKFLKELTGFQLRPVAGFLSAREFLAGLAFRLFHCTLYVRHHSDPSYTPEPDCCHELLGHVPLLADLSFSQFSQEIGLASLGASEEEVKKLASCYFFSVEFGLCKQDGEIRAYGAGLLSCFAELKHALSGNSEIRPFDPPKVVQAECNITTFQNAYFYTDSFEDAKDKMRKFVSTIKRPFSVRYNPYTERMDILSNAHEIINVVNELNGDLSIISHALQKIEGIQLQEIEKTV